MHEMDPTIPIESCTNIKVENENGHKSLPSMGCSMEIKQELIESTMTVDCENIYDPILTIKDEFCTPSNVTLNSNVIEGTLEAHKEQVLGKKSNSEYTEHDYSYNISSPAVHTKTESSIPSLPTEVKSEDIIATVKGGSCENNQLTNILEEKNNKVKYLNVKNNTSNNLISGTLVKRLVKRKRNSKECNKNTVELETTEVNFTTSQYKIKKDTNSVIKRENQLVTTADNFPTNQYEIKSDTTKVTNNERLNTPSLISIAIRPVIIISDECTDICNTEYTCEIYNLQSEDIVKVKTDNECNTQLQCSNIENKCSCSLCEIINRKSLIVDNHDKEGFVCSICNYKFRLKVQLIRHMKTHTDEAEDKPYSCHICPFKARLKSHINTHIRTHTGEKPYTCEICPFRTGLKYSLVRHIRVHKGEKRVQCNICHYKCTQKTSLTEHMRTHTGEKPFSCYLCDFKCSYKQSLNVHLKNHRGHKPFSCDLCEFRCILKSQLSTHMRRHTGEKPYACNVCGFRSARKGNIDKHMRVHLKKVVLKKLCFNLNE